MKTIKRLAVLSALVAPLMAHAAGGSSTYLQNSLLVDNLLRSKAFTQLTNVYVALYTTCPAAPTSSNPGTEVNPNGTAYQRVAVSIGSGGSWNPTQGGGGTGASTGTGGQTSNVSQLTFPTPSGSNWGTVNCWGLFDVQCTSSTVCGNGNLLIWGTITTPQAINVGQAAPYFAAAALTITWSSVLELFDWTKMQAANEPSIPYRRAG
jgi:hypothetical protein